MIKTSKNYLSCSYNTVLTGMAGVGRTTLIEQIIMNQSQAYGKTFIIEEGRNYTNLCEVLNGNQIEFNPIAQICINPFALINDTQMYEQQPAAFDDEEVSQITEILRLMTGLDNEDQKNLRMLERAIINSIKQKKNKATISTVVEFLKLENAKQSIKMVESLQPFIASGEYSAFFEGASAPTLQQINVYELEALSNFPQLRDIVLCTLLFMVNQVIREERVKNNVCIIDDVASLFANSNISEGFITQLYRLARPRNGAFITTTQSIDDYAKNEVMNSMYVNSEWKLLLQHSNPIKTVGFLSEQRLSESSDLLLISDRHTEEICKLILD